MRSHARLLKLGLDAHPVAATRLLQSYAARPSTDSLHSARRLFDQVPSKDALLWTAMLAAYAHSGHPTDALRLLSQMHRLHRFRGGPAPNHYTYASAARAAGSAADPHMAAALHTQVIKSGFESNVVVGTSVLDMYSKCGDITSAREVFDEMTVRNVVTWNSMIAGYTTEDMGGSALDLFHEMKCVKFEEPDEFTITSVLTACAATGDLASGRQIHSYSVKGGFREDLAILNSLANMYFRCGEVEWAERAMEERESDLLSKLVMIKGYAFNGRYLELMRGISGSNFVEIVLRDPSLSVSVLAACANLSLVRTGRQVHSLIVTLGCYQNCCHMHFDGVAIGSALIDMYCRFSSVGDARNVFESLVEKGTAHWNAFIAGCLKNHLLEEACQLFNKMPERNVISWTAMITGHVQHGLPLEGLRLLANMYGENCSTTQGNQFTFVAALNACGCLAALDLGKQIHGQVLRVLAAPEVDNSIFVETALLCMYSKSGNLNYARKIFDMMRKRNVVAWSSMITSFAVHGMGLEALEVFEEMLKLNFEPNEVTFVAVLNACSHCGLVEKGLDYFKLMKEKYGIVPRGDHYTCMIDMLGRAGKLAEAWSYAEKINDAETSYNKETAFNIGRYGDIWDALLGSCSLHSNVEIGRKVACKILEGKPKASDAYVAISNMYADAKMWDDVYKFRERWWCNDVVKRVPGLSHIQITAAS
uniref:Pentatricopeptide repeat-containing protein At1g11290 n=1 Tax=Anthurium amnicola TaxID=1678845 RepID=A0A1D1YB16_9ARAE